MSNTAYQQLSSYLKKINAFKSLAVPTKGWVMAVRNGLGMSRRQLATRLDLSTSRIQRLEEDEVVGAVTLKTMRRTAEAMDCVFVYALIPRTSLDDTLQTQALKKAKAHLNRVSHSMALESQALDDEANKEMLQTMAKQIINQSKSTLWDD